VLVLDGRRASAKDDIRCLLAGAALRQGHAIVYISHFSKVKQISDRFLRDGKQGGGMTAEAAEQIVSMMGGVQDLYPRSPGKGVSGDPNLSGKANRAGLQLSR
jgi:ABC-type sugar transport system ATPase subunit